LDSKLCLCEYKLKNFEKSIFHSKRSSERKLENVKIECLCNIELNHYEDALLNAIELYKKKEKDLNFYLSKIYKLENKKLNELKSLLSLKKISNNNNKSEVINQLCDYFFRDDKKKINHQIESFGEKPKIFIFPSNQIYNQRWIIFNQNMDQFKIYTYDFIDSKWDILNSILGLEKFLYASFLVIEDSVYLFFMSTEDVDRNRALRIDLRFGNVEVFLDSESSKYNVVNYKPKRRMNFSTIHFEGKIYIFGGSYNDDIVNLIEEFNLENKKMRKISNVKVPALSNHTSDLWNHSMIIFGGIYSTKSSSNDIYCLNLTDFKCEKILVLGDLPPEVRDHSSVIYGLNQF
jgi:hypothetical protein